MAKIVRVWAHPDGSRPVSALRDGKVSQRRVGFSIGGSFLPEGEDVDASNPYYYNSICSGDLLSVAPELQQKKSEE